MAVRRNTLQREIILQTVRSMHNHPTADAVYKKIAQEHPTISRATVYRNLRLLAGEGEVRRVELPGNADSFDFNTALHYHVVCEDCGAAADVDLPYRAGLEKKLTAAEGFTVYGHDILFRGLCPACRRKRQSRAE